MNNTLNHKQMAIRSLTAQHTQLTDAWLRSKGLNAHGFLTESTLVQRAVMAAKTLQRAHAELLKSRDVHTLNEFLRAAATKRTRAGITDSFCYKVLNISTAVNRQLYKASNQLANTSNTNTNTTRAPKYTKAKHF